MTEPAPKTEKNDGLDARRLAARFLHGVFVEKKQIDEIGLGSDFAPAARARARSLAAGVIRRRDVLDAVIAAHMERKPPFAALNLLRIAAWELHFDDVPAHAAIGSAVGVAKRGRKTAQFAGLINAVGRRLAEAHLGDVEPQPLPKYLRTPFVTAFGEAAVTGIEAVLASPPPVDLTLRDPAEASSRAEELNAEVLPTGSLRLRQKPQISALPGYDDGAFWVQDAAAALPARMLGDVKDARVLDLCAAPGGKTLQLASRGADVTALDLSDVRLHRLEENLRRTKLKAEVIAADATEWTPDGVYDAILLDAPCSATGTLRRHPELPIIRANTDLQPVFRLQRDLLSRAMGWLKPGGVMCFATCSLLPVEGEDLIARLGLSPHIDAANPQDLGVPATWIAPEGWLRTRPDFWADQGGVDGFFAVRLKA